MYFLVLEKVQEHRIILQVSIGTGGDARRYNHIHKCPLGLGEVQENKCLLGMRQVQENGIIMYVLLQE